MVVDLIPHRGEPQGSAPSNSETHTNHSQKITPELTPETEFLKQENQFLRERIGELEAGKVERGAMARFREGKG